MVLAKDRDALAIILGLANVAFLQQMPATNMIPRSKPRELNVGM